MTSTEGEEEPERQKGVELGGSDLDNAKVDDMAQALEKLECEKRGVLESIRVLRVRLADEKEDQSDVYYYLHKKLDDNYDVISALERQLMVETADREKAETEYARQIEDLEIRRDEELGPLKERLMTEEEQLNSLHEAAKNKKEADAKRACLEDEIQKTESMVENDLNTERRKKLQEKQRIRRQVEDEIMELSSELFSQKEVELADKTMRAKDNNEKLHAALQAKAKQAERMMVTNQGLAFENRSLRNDLDLAKASEVVLDKHVRLYHDLVISLKARLEQETCDAEEEDDASNREEQERLVELEETLASSSGGGGGGGGAAGLDTASLLSDTPPGAQVIWAGGACGALSYESVDELRVAVQSLQRLHAELQAETKSLTARIEESRAAVAAAEASGGSSGGDRNPVVSCLLEAAETWMSLMASRPADTPKDEAERGNGAGRGGGGDSCGLALPASTTTRERATFRRSASDGDNTRSSGRRGRSQTGRKDRRNIPIIDSSTSKGGSMVTAMGVATPGTGQGGRQGPPHQERDRSDGKTSAPSGGVRKCGGGGALAMATKTPLRRRELFYHLVDAFREYQKTTAANVAAGVGGSEVVCGNARGQRTLLESNPSTSATVANAAAAESAPGYGGGGCNGGALPPIGASHGGDCGGSGGGGPVSDNLSVSVRTLCDFGPPERRSVWTQTVAKYFPEKFASVRPARRLVVNSTFLTTNSTVTNNSALSPSSVRSWGYGPSSLDSQPGRRL